MSFSDLRFIIASDVLLACLFPLAILFLGYKHVPSFSFSELKDLLLLGRRKTRQYGHFSLERAHESYAQYARLAEQELSLMRKSYSTLGRANKNIGYRIGYPRKLDRLKDVTDLNATIPDGIAELALEEFPSLKTKDPVAAGSADLGRVRESLKHFVRDWSEEGAAERTRIFAPILDLLRGVEAQERGGLRVLVPGCGLGRLAWEISQLANELSFFMTLSLRFLLSPKTTTVPNEHILRPYAHWFSHQRTNGSLFRGISFPDDVPRLSSTFRLVEEDFMKLKPSSSNAQGEDRTYLSGYDYVVTLFFIDTSLDVLSTISHIHTLLRPGGTWINLGPLLWTGGAQAKVELSLEEVLQAAEEIGFVIDRSKEGLMAQRTVECEYTGDRNAMMRWIYKAEFWVARKSK
ncbi:hypothetical protein NLJ89_g5094 [Agrocybe chaxingu]|uniref:N2227-domain-containing protein n=1 Tax=Agrocybe chaxingu TaxID=84603 RepID=A0A9W8K8T1_9AGAR|nr:hypothetical protein NLJ89_g5094 [Agrocybe chaxingu]